MLTKPIIFGNKSSYFGKKRESDGHTHSWTCYFKSFNNEVNRATEVNRELFLCIPSFITKDCTKYSRDQCVDKKVGGGVNVQILFCLTNYF